MHLWRCCRMTTQPSSKKHLWVKFLVVILIVGICVSIYLMLNSSYRTKKTLWIYLNQNSNRINASTTNTKTSTPTINYAEDEYSDMYNCKNKKDKFSVKERLVHLDLKGAPPKISYYQKIFPLFKMMGATGLLIEYEDTFPYKGALKSLACPQAYTESEILELLSLARKNGLHTIIPLVQTFGHMEFVLKHPEFKGLREVSSQINAISPGNNGTMRVINEMLAQLLRLHKSVKYIHIGCDEVYGMGSGQSKTFMREKSFSTADLLIYHVKRIVTSVRSHGVTPLMWDDMFRDTTTLEQLQRSGLGEMVELVVWKYAAEPQRELKKKWWMKYQRSFKNTWIATAFKGGEQQSDSIVLTQIRVKNHINWLELMTKYGKGGDGQLTFHGAILTGWQRFSHTMPLCELLPVGLPSLGMCLQVLSKGCLSFDSLRFISVDVLKCDDVIHTSLQAELTNPAQCRFPGHEIYNNVQMLYCMNSGPMCPTSPISSPNSEELKRNLTKHLKEIYQMNTVNEWIEDHFN